MKKSGLIIWVITVFINLLSTPSFGQFFIAGGYQNGELGSGGDETLDVIYLEDKGDMITFYPNPFHAINRIDISLNRSHSVSIFIFDLNSRKIKIIVSQTRMEQGIRTFKWDGSDENGNAVAPGTYLYQFIIDNHSYFKKIIRL
ncbi:MAG: T9SS type A sorting domain-containing protein [Bacteroidetes bacterium]|nr:T9SS type A sorting domain-containing protein [Bacteroidota bacterium]